jgi:serine/threonine protein kinase
MILMSATSIDTAFPSDEPPHGRTPPTTDLDMTTDLHEQNTSGLEPTTVETTIDTKSSPAESAVADGDALIDNSRAAVVSPEAWSAPEERSPDPVTPAVRAQTEPAHATALAPGVVLNDRFLLEQVIGYGGVSIVYRARDMNSSVGPARAVQVALKTPRPELHDHDRARARLSHEHQHTRALSHPNIVRAFDLQVDAEPCYMTMELLEGNLLSAIMREWKTVPAPFAYRILQGCARALAHAHGRSIVHGDFKPGNVFITRDETVKVIDFGAAAAPRTQVLRIPAGTPAYASPEVLSGEAPELRDDIFSFACVAYELLTGAHPFDRRSSLQAREEGHLPPRAWNLSASQWLTLLSALSWRREQRPNNIEALVIALTPEARAGAATGARNDRALAQEVAAPRELSEDLMPPQRSWGFFIFIACALAVTFIAAQRQNEEPQTEEQVVETQTPLELTSPAPEMLSAPAGLMAAPVETTNMGGPRRASLGRAAPNVAESTGAAFASSGTGPPPAQTQARAMTDAKGSGARLSEISFEADSIVTGEGSVAAVFLIKRSQPLSGRTRVQWQAISGTAESGVDFAANAGGSVEFADGQAQRAIYVPLRNDLLKEGDETFTVRLQSARGARLGKANTVEASIRDDD